MLEIEDFNKFENIFQDGNQENLDDIFKRLFRKVKADLNLEPYRFITKVTVKQREKLNSSKTEDIFSMGVKRIMEENGLRVQIYEDSIKFIVFILLREVYNCFIPDKLKSHEIVHLVINQILMVKLNKHKLLNEWKLIIRRNLEDFVSLSKGVNRLFAFDRLEKFFNNQGKDTSYNPIQFFFEYLRKNESLITDGNGDIFSKNDDIHTIFFTEFQNNLLDSINKDDMVETIKCIVEIFYKVRRYPDLLTYRKLFQKYKTNYKLSTELSLRKFASNMEWIKKNTYIAPSYQVNWNALNLCLISSFLRFNPLLSEEKIYSFIHNLPFFISPKISHQSFTIDVIGYFIIPKVYLNDFLTFIKKLEDFGYITKSKCLMFEKYQLLLNLNYFREYSKKYRLRDPHHSMYNSNYELEFIINYGNSFQSSKLSFLDFLVLDRLRFFSVSGFGFERTAETINQLKSDLLNGLITERKKFTDLKNILKIFYDSNELKSEIIEFLNHNKRFGFFYLRSMLDECLITLKIIKDILLENPNIKNIYQFRESIKKQVFTDSIEKNFALNNQSTKNILYKDLITVYFNSKTEFKRKCGALKNFHEFFKCCYELKIFNLNSMKTLLLDKELVKVLYKTKEERLKNYYEKIKPYKITGQKIDTIMDKFLNSTPPIIKPNLLNTIIPSMFVKEFLPIILIDSQDTRKNLEKIQNIFPITLINSTKDLESGDKLLYIEIGIPSLAKQEKNQFYSMFNNLFKSEIVYMKSHLSSGMFNAFSRKDFYDFSNKNFFYTKDLYDQYFLFVQQIFGTQLNPLPDDVNNSQDIFWSNDASIENLIEKVIINDQMENVDLNPNSLDKLQKFTLTLEQNLLNEEKFSEIKKEYFFKNFVKAIKFIPSFQHFGFENFYVYLYATERSEIDFRLLFMHTYQKIRYPACIDNSNSLFIKYIMPYRKPNMGYLNWLTKTKKIIREYVAFSVRKIHQIFHIDYNLSFDEWNYEADKFKIYMQNILFNPNYKPQIQGIKAFNCDEIRDSKRFGPDSQEFEDLIKSYNWQSADLKSIIGSRKYSQTTSIMNLLREKLIFPFIKFKNLGFREKLYIIITDVKKEVQSILIKIFNFFNLGFIYEIEGEYYIHGLNNELKFENGLMIKLYFPDCEISEYKALFELLFQYLEIEHYLILNDLIDGKNLLKAIYGDLDFLDTYNPLINLEWNSKDKVWMNPKQFNSKFEPIYPKLLPDGKLIKNLNQEEGEHE